jgi:predicted phage-related endonuclease
MLISMPATREEWLAMRLKFVGASESPALFGVQAPYQLDHYALHMVKAGRADPPYVGGERIKWGQRLEEVVALGIGEEFGYEIAKGRYAIADDCPGMGASLDFEMAFDPTGEFEGPGVLETKNVDWMVHKRSWADGEPPIHILLQNQHQLAATGWKWGAVGALVGGNELKLYRYPAKPDLIGNIKSRVAQFWADVASGDNPDPSWSESAADVLRALYPETVDEQADLRLDNELPDICARLLDAGERRRAAEKAEAEAKNQLVAKLGLSRRAIAQGFWINTSVTPEKPASIITPDMVGKPISGRKEVRRYTVKPMEDQGIAA